jgi:hypothetical protein
VHDTTACIEFGVQVRSAYKVLLGHWAERMARVVSMLIFSEAIPAKIEVWAIITGHEFLTRQFLN